jgi:hypothetical protein
MRDRTERKKLEDARHQLLNIEREARQNAEKAKLEQMLAIMRNYREIKNDLI